MNALGAIGGPGGCSDLSPPSGINNAGLMLRVLSESRSGLEVQGTIDYSLQ